MGGTKRKMWGSNVGTAPCSLWHACCTCSVPGALGFVAFSSLTLSRAEKSEFFKVDFHPVGGAKVWREQCWGWHAFSSCSVHGLQGSMVFSTLTLSVTLTSKSSFLSRCPGHKLCQEESCWESNLWEMGLSFSEIQSPKPTKMILTKT